MERRYRDPVSLTASKLVNWLTGDKQTSPACVCVDQETSHDVCVSITLEIDLLSSYLIITRCLFLVAARYDYIPHASATMMKKLKAAHLS